MMADKIVVAKCEFRKITQKTQLVVLGSHSKQNAETLKTCEQQNADETVLLLENTLQTALRSTKTALKKSTSQCTLWQEIGVDTTWPVPSAAHVQTFRESPTTKI